MSADDLPVDTLELPSHSYSVLAHAEVEQVAREVGVRLLHFKGYFAKLDFPQRGGGAGDADILVEPAGMTKLVSALLECGWVKVDDNLEGTAGHGQTLRHQKGSVEVDLHHYAQGMRSHWIQGFEHLWQRRRSTDFTYPALAVPAFLDHAVLLLADAVSDTISDQERRTRRRQAILEALSQDDLAVLDGRAKELGLVELVADASGSSLSFTQMLRQRLVLARHSPALKSLAVWGLRIADEPTVRGKAQVLRDAILWTPQGLSSQERARYFFQRLRKAGRQVPVAASELARAALRRSSKAITDTTLQSAPNPAGEPTTPEPSEADAPVISQSHAAATVSAEVAPSAAASADDAGDGSGDGAALAADVPPEAATLPPPLSRDIVYLMHEDGAAALQRSTRKIANLRGIGLLVWLAWLDGHRDVDDIAQVVLEEAGAVPPGVPLSATEIVAQTLTELEGFGLLR